MLGGHVAAEPSRVVHLTTHGALLLAENSFLSVGRKLAVMTLVIENASGSAELATIQAGRGLGSGLLRGHCFT